MKRTAPIVVFGVLTFAATACGGDPSARTASSATAPPTTGAHDAPARPVEAWRWDAPAPASVGMPATDDEGVVASYGHHALVHLDPDGELVWDVEIDELRDVAPLLLDNAVVVATEEGLVAVNRTDGAERWSAPTPDRANTPVLAGERIVTTTWDGDLAAFEAGDGRPAWSMRLPGSILGPPASTDEVAVTTWDGGDGAGLVAVDVVTGVERWRVELPSGAVSAPTVTTGDQPVVMAVARDLAVHAFDLRTGEVTFVVPTAGGAGSPEVPPLALPDGRVLVADRLTGFVLLDGEGQEEWRQEGVGAAVRGGPAGPDRAGRFALPVDRGEVLIAGPDHDLALIDPEGRVPGVAVAPGGEGFVVATREAEVNSLVRYRH